MSHPVRGIAAGVPVALSSFVGRRREVSEAKRLLSISRLVTLTGPGGVGKTRLALEVTSAVHKLFPDGMVFVALEQLRDPTLVPNAVAVDVGLREQAGSGPLEMLVDYLGPRRLMLVLDNCEHVIDAVGALANALLLRCPELRIMATSRESLRVPGEVLMPVPPLTVPDVEQPLEENNPVTYEAVTLFVARAASAVPGYALSEENQGAVMEICRRLDGLPLAIELAAARMHALAEKDILARLPRYPQLLTAGPRTAPDRQRTLRSCIEWSHGLCSAREQLLWARLSVFAGGFELDSAEAICTGDGLGVEEVLHAVASLLDKSILVGEPHGKVVRYRMLETVREFGRERLEETGEHADLRRRHRDWCMQLAERARADWVSPRQVDWFARLDREHADVQEAVSFSLTERGELESGLRMLTSLFHFYWWGRGWAREGRLLLARALDQPSPPSVVRARALLTDASLALADGDREVGKQRLAEARAIAETVTEPAIAAQASWVIGSAALYSGDLPGAIATFEEGLGILGSGGDLPVRLDLLLTCAIAAGLVGDEERATACHMESLRITEPAGECFHRSYALWALGLLAMQQGDYQRAAELHQQSVRLRRELHDLTGVGWSLESLAWAESGREDHERAARLLGAADKLWEIMGRPLHTYQHLLPYHEDCKRSARERLGDGQFETAFEHGRGMSVHDAIGFALDEHAATDSPLKSPTVLSRREHEIAELVAEGLSNRDIASRLMISVRTSETHVQNILTKLGFRSRAQIATWIAEEQVSAQRHLPGNQGH